MGWPVEHSPVATPVIPMMRNREFEIRESEDGPKLRGVMIQEGRAASGGRAEVFTPGSVSWPADGVGILLDHRQAPETRAIPQRQSDGRITLATRATDAIREAVAAGKRFMSVEFHSLQERVTRGGVREIMRAIVPSAALVAEPEYDVSSAEVRQRGGFRTRMKPGRKVDCRCSARKTGSNARNVEFAHTAFEDLPDDVAAVVRGLDTTVGRTADGSLRLRTARDGSLVIDLDPLDTTDGRRLRELIDAGVPVHARPVWDPDLSTWTLRGDTAVVTAAVFALLLVRPVQPDRAVGLDPLEPVARPENRSSLVKVEPPDALERLLRVPEHRRVRLWL